MANIVIYGSEISGLCAAFKLRGNLVNDKNNQHNIKIISTTPSGKLGGLATIGGLNMWDVKGRSYNGEVGKPHLCQFGTFGYLYKEYSQVYKVYLKEETNHSGEKDMCQVLEDMITAYNNDPNGQHIKIEVLRAMDIIDVDYTTNTEQEIDRNNNTITYESKNVDRLYLRSIYKASNGYIKWGRKTRVIEADYFIDASDDGKLTAFLTPVTVGRYDWPKTYLEPCECSDISPVARQQAATLYFRVTNTEYNSTQLYPRYTKDNDGDVYNSSNNSHYKFNTNDEWYNNSNFYIKGYNSGKNGEDDYWLNTTLLFNVDGRAHYRDIVTPFYPKYMLSDSMIRDKAWVFGKEYIDGKTPNEVIGKNKNEDTPPFISGLRGFDRLKNATVKKLNNEPLVAEQLYIRESVHLPIDANIVDNGTEISNYAIKRCHTLCTSHPETALNQGPDKANKNTCIGMGEYLCDIHPFKKTDLLEKNEQGVFDYYTDKNESYIKMRPDLEIQIKEHCGYPVYIPYSAMHTKNIKNMLVAGNAIGCCSFSWGEMRVLPNLCVVGDAAGIAIAYSIRTGTSLTDIPITDMDNYQKVLTCSKNDTPPEGLDNLWWTNNVLVEKSLIGTNGVRR